MATKKAAKAMKKDAAGDAPKKRAAKAASKGAAKKAATKKSATKKAAPRKTAGKQAAAGTDRGVARNTGRKATKAAKATKTAQAPKRAAKKAVGQAAPRKAQAEKAATRKAPANKAAARKTVGKQATRSAGKTGAGKATKREQALANTQALLKTKQEQDRQPSSWQQIEQRQGGAAGAAPEQDRSAAADRTKLHVGESNKPAIHGSISAIDRRNQGKRDSR